MRTRPRNKGVGRCIDLPTCFNCEYCNFVPANGSFIIDRKAICFFIINYHQKYSTPKSSLRQRDRMRRPGQLALNGGNFRVQLLLRSFEVPWMDRRYHRKSRCIGEIVTIRAPYYQRLSTQPPTMDGTNGLPGLLGFRKIAKRVWLRWCVVHGTSGNRSVGRHDCFNHRVGTILEWHSTDIHCSRGVGRRRRLVRVPWVCLGLREIIRRCGR
jgi:hypothetical protein